MAKDNCQKIKLLKLIEILQQESDEQHPLRATEICTRLLSLGITCDRRTLTKDVTLLNEQGFDVATTMVGHEKCYYIEDRSFSISELKILIDAVQASNFITEEKTAKMVEKIAGRGGSRRAEILKSNLVCFNTRKHSNESIYDNIAQLEEALQIGKKVIFRYFDLDEHGEKVYRRGGHHYVLEPVAIVFNEDNYYLVSYSAKHDNTANYRVDRMNDVEIIDEPLSEQALALRKNVSDYTEQVFKMYGGPEENITIQFSNKLIGAVYDKFGESIKMIPIGTDECAATVKVQISATFWGWLFQFGKQMKVISPQSVIEEYKKQLMALAE